MTTQERINQLAGAALRSGPVPATPKPATFMPSFEKMKSPEFVAPAPVTEPKPATISSAPATAAQVGEIPPETSESEQELRAMIEARDEKFKKRQTRANRAMTIALLVIFAAGGTWLAVSPVAHAKMNALVAAIKQSGNDVKGLTSVMGTYDKQLDQVAVQGARIDEATKALGVDPDTDTSAQGSEINGAMKDMSGDGGPTGADRDELLKRKFGIVSKVAERDEKAPPEAESDVKF